MALRTWGKFCFLLAGDFADRGRLEPGKHPASLREQFFKPPAVRCGDAGHRPPVVPRRTPTLADRLPVSGCLRAHSPFGKLPHMIVITWLCSLLTADVTFTVPNGVQGNRSSLVARAYKQLSTALTTSKRRLAGEPFRRHGWVPDVARSIRAAGAYDPGRTSLALMRQPAVLCCQQGASHRTGHPCR